MFRFLYALLLLSTFTSLTPQDYSVSALAFGTGGIRAAANSPLLANDSLVLIGHAIAKWYRADYLSRKPIFIAGDTRVSTERIKTALATGLSREHLQVIDGGTLPTPAVIARLQDETYDLGIMVTASHNPAEDNGIKIVKKSGYITKQEETTLANLFASMQGQGVLLRQLPSSASLLDQQEKSYLHYKNFVRSFFPTLDLSGLTVVLDCAHGATHRIAPDLFRSFGAHVITIGNHPDGYNINEACGSQCTDTLKRAVLAHRADVGFAFDGDGDRIVAINRDGIEKNGDDLLALLLQHPALSDANPIVGTVMTELGFARYLQQHQKQLVRTPVGERHVTNYLQVLSSGLGGESCGHIVMPDYLPCSDGIVVALRVLESMLAHNNKSLTTFPHLGRATQNISIRRRINLETGLPAQITQEHKDRALNGRIVVRYSGTEPLLRILVEMDTQARAQALAKELAHALSPLLN